MRLSKLDIEIAKTELSVPNEWLQNLQSEVVKVVVIYDFQFEVELLLIQTHCHRKKEDRKR
jgi:hypothetical protein